LSESLGFAQRVNSSPEVAFLTGGHAGSVPLMNESQKRSRFTTRRWHRRNPAKPGQFVRKLARFAVRWQGESACDGAPYPLPPLPGPRRGVRGALLIRGGARESGMTERDERRERLVYLLMRVDVERNLPGYRGGTLARHIRASAERRWRAELALRNKVAGIDGIARR